MNIEKLKTCCEYAATHDGRDAYFPTTVPVVLTSHDWREAFGAAGRESTTVNANVRRLIGHVQGDVSPEPFGRADVAWVVAIAEGQNDGPNWVCVGRLVRGEWFTVAAGCDYTGWGCQQWGQAYVDLDLDAILRLGLSDEDRDRLVPVADDLLFARADAGEGDCS